MTEVLVRRVSSVLDRSTSRRGFLVRVAGVSAAVAVGPLRFLLYPDSATALTPAQCESGRCSKGYHEFCCSVTGDNLCPPFTYTGGWWKCETYTGGGVCSSVGHRYYMDCHLDSSQFSCNCACARGTCSCRRVCCSRFHYGNCNAARSGQPDPIICRRVVCSNPGTLYPSTCSQGGTRDPRTCRHQPCTDCL